MNKILIGFSTVSLLAVLVMGYFLYQVKGNLTDSFVHTGLLITELKNRIAELQKENKETITRYDRILAELNAIGSINNKPIIITKPTDKETYSAGSYYVAVVDNQLAELTELTVPFKDHRLDGNFSLRFDSKELIANFSYKLNLKIFGEVIEIQEGKENYTHKVRLWETDKNGKKLSELSIIAYDVLKKSVKLNTWQWKAPHLDIGLGLGVDSGLNLNYGPSVGLSIFGYGATSDDLLFRFPRFSVVVGTERFIGAVSPIQYNLGKNIPLISNLWLGPDFGLTSRFNMFIGMSINGVI